MAKYMSDEVAYYYDSHPTQEDLMGETEARKKEAEARRANALAEKLRSLGIDPDKI